MLPNAYLFSSVKLAMVQNIAWTKKQVLSLTQPCLLFSLVAKCFGHFNHYQGIINSMDCAQVQLGDDTDSSDFGL